MSKHSNTKKGITRKTGRFLCPNNAPKPELSLTSNYVLKFYQKPVQDKLIVRFGLDDTIRVYQENKLVMVYPGIANMIKVCAEYPVKAAQQYDQPY